MEKKSLGRIEILHAQGLKFQFGPLLNFWAITFSTDIEFGYSYMRWKVKTIIYKFHEVHKVQF